MDQSNYSILIIYTGGTIGMVKDPESGALKPFNFDNIYQQIPILETFNNNLTCISFDELIDSSNVRPEFWIRLATMIEEKYEDYDGFVILHGSDTMAYSASALSFLLENLNKPVVFTGSQLPMGVLRTDGRENIINAIEAACAWEENTPVLPEVSVCFENKIFRGNRTHKFNAENFEAFISGNYPPLAEVGVHIRYNRNYILKPNFRKLRVYKKMDTRVAILKLFPGIDRHIVHSILTIEGLRAVVLETFGAGNAPTDKWFISALQDAIESGIIILNVTQCKGGAVEIGKYETSIDLGRIGVISGHDITTEAAVTKLMFLLGNAGSDERIKDFLQKPLRGEMTLDK